MSIINPPLCPSQQARLDAVRINHPEAVVVRCSDEKTGKRFGEALCRIDKCVRIGSGGRNRRKWAPYQLWASWAPCDARMPK